MSRRIVITQPYYFPWYGFMDLVRNADLLVFYDDVQYSKGGFMNRVQVKTPVGSNWLTVPVENYSLGQNINQIQINNRVKWIEKHLKTVKQYYSKTPFFEQTYEKITQLFSQKLSKLSDLTMATVNFEMDELGFEIKKYKSSELNIRGNGSERVLSIVKHFGCDTYITAMGALRYLDFELFDNNGVETRFIDYENKQYPQLYGEFNPFVTALDLFMNCGPDSNNYLGSESVHWREFIRTEKARNYLNRYEK